MKKFFSYFIPIVILIVGLILIFNKQITNIYVAEISHQRMSEVSRQDIKKNSQQKGEYDFKKVKSIDNKQILKSNNHNVAVIGKLSIPSVEMNLPIVKGVSNDALTAGGGTMKKDEQMGQGNYALAGHYMTAKGALFSPLEQIKLGNLVYITDLTKVYTYRVTKKQVIDPTDTNVINDQPGKKMITLITCADGGKNRWSIQGNLIKTTSANKKALTVFK